MLLALSFSIQLIFIAVGIGSEVGRVDRAVEAQAGRRSRSLAFSWTDCHWLLSIPPFLAHCFALQYVYDVPVRLYLIYTIIAVVVFMQVASFSVFSPFFFFVPFILNRAPTVMQKTSVIFVFSGRPGWNLNVFLPCFRRGRHESSSPEYRCVFWIFCCIIEAYCWQFLHTGHKRNGCSRSTPRSPPFEGFMPRVERRTWL